MLTIAPRTAKMPRWPGLKHFTKVFAVEFTDARKFEDLIKVYLKFYLLFALHLPGAG